MGVASVLVNCPFMVMIHMYINDIPMTPQPQLSAAPKSPETGLSWVRASFLANINNTDWVWFVTCYLT